MNYCEEFVPKMGNQPPSGTDRAMERARKLLQDDEKDKKTGFGSLFKEDK